MPGTKRRFNFLWSKKNYTTVLKRIFTIGNVRIGGDYGEIPTVLIGSIFYMNHRIVKDPQTGSFDEEKAGALIKTCNALSEQLGVKYMLDVIGNTPEALIRYITFFKRYY